MHLTERRRGVQSANHEELEVLLESFEKQVEEITNEAETIQVPRLRPRAARRAG
jgi:magnesium transporter